MTSQIELRGITKRYTTAGGVTALQAVDLQVRAGEFVAVVGKSGSGKSTLLNLVAGIDRPTSGEIHVAGTRVDTLDEGRLATWRGRNVGVVFQFFQLLPTLTVLENVALPMDLCHVSSPREARQRAMALLEGVGIAGDERAEGASHGPVGRQPGGLSTHGQAAGGALGGPAAARRHRPGAGQRSAGHRGGRAHGQPGLAHGRVGPGASGRQRGPRAHGADGDPRARRRGDGGPRGHPGRRSGRNGRVPCLAA